MVNKNNFNKKAQGLSVTTIILIVLGLIVLVVLILGFTKGWNNLKQWVAPSNNVKDIVSQCNIACNTEQKYNYCYDKKDLKVDGKIIKDTTCYILAKKRPGLGVSVCENVVCDIDDIKPNSCEKEGGCYYITNENSLGHIEKEKSSK